MTNTLPPASPSPTPPAGPAPKKSSTKKRVLTGLAVLVVLYLLGVACSSMLEKDDDKTAAQPTTTQAAPARDDRAEYNAKLELTAAELDCREAVKARLNSPTTAEFSGITTKKRPDSKIVTVGDVDSENGFGATLRSSFTCTSLNGTTTVDRLE